MIGDSRLGDDTEAEEAVRALVEQLARNATWRGLR